MKSRRRKYKKPMNAKKRTYKGIEFKSTLELYMYKALEKEGIKFEYEGQKFVIIEGFKYEGESYERFLNGKGEFKDRGNKKYADMVYTPDFTPPSDKPLKWVIETKGRAMPDFSRTWKLFKKLIVNKGLDTVLFVPRKQADCDRVIELIKRLDE